MLRFFLSLAVAFTTVLLIPGRGDSPSTADKPNAAKTIALLLPESKTTRYEAQDRPAFTAYIKQHCPRCTVLYANADQDPANQQAQVEAAIANRADVIVVAPVDTASARAFVRQAKRLGTAIVSYDRLIANADVDFYVSFDNVRVGRLQAQSLVDRLDQLGRPRKVVALNGAATDPNAGQFKQGAHSVFRDKNVQIAKEYDTPDWSPDSAQQQMDQAITALGTGGFTGVYAANDGLAGAAIASMKGAGLDPRAHPVTGQDADLAGIQHILTDDQYMTVYKPIRAEARAAAEVALKLAFGQAIPPQLINARMHNGVRPIPSRLLDPIVVTKQNIAETILHDGFLTTRQICTPAYAKACKTAGIAL